jgi:hypothetical protein
MKVLGFELHCSPPPKASDELPDGECDQCKGLRLHWEAVHTGLCCRCYSKAWREAEAKDPWYPEEEKT